MRPLKWLVPLALAGIASPSAAGPPYQTDDPEPTDLHHWEIYNFVAVDGRHQDVDGAAGLDLNYGAAKDLQLTATLPTPSVIRRPVNGTADRAMWSSAPNIVSFTMR